MPQSPKLNPMASSDHPNFVLIPLMAPGHIIPMIDMAKLLAKRGVRVTIIVTPLNATRFNSVINRAVESGLPIQLLQVKFPCDEAGLPPGCESADNLPTYDLLRNFNVAINLLQKPLEEILQKLNPCPSCIICDKHLSWTADTCNKFKIPRIIFDGMNCFTQLVMHNLYFSKIHETVLPTEFFIVPGLPDEMKFTRLQLPGLLNPGSRDSAIDFREQVRKTESQSYGVVVNSFEELENKYVEEFRKLKGGKVWCIGPLSLCSDNNLDLAQRGNQSSIDSKHCLKWLDNMKPRSVVYACLGSLSRLSRAQFVELALGLEESGCSFILVVKGENSKDIEKWIVEDGIEERTKERGLFIRGWAPQVLILLHCSIGGFLTHCGWNSTLEGISVGLPMITWPLFGEQFFNEKLVVQILGIGVAVGAQVVTHLGEEEKRETMVRRDGIREGIMRVMDEGEEGIKRRKRAKEFGEMAKMAIGVGGSSYMNITRLIQDIEQLVKNKQET